MATAALDRSAAPAASPPATPGIEALLAGLLLLIAPAAAAAQAVFRGQVVDVETGQPVPAVQVLLTVGDTEPGGRALTTGADGRFSLRAVPPGSFLLEFRRVGYRPFRTARYRVHGDTVVALRVALAPLAQPLDPVTSEADGMVRHPLLDGFAERRRLGLGEFFTRAEIDARSPRTLRDLLQGVPGLPVTGSARRPLARPSRSASARYCQAVLYLDGVRASRSDDPPEVLGSLLQSIAGTHLEAVELYMGRSQLPAAFGDPDVRCGAIVVWTRVPEI